ncbi:hypothetical protein STEG23_004107, partial [Scotinomys teguina]
MSAVMLLPGTNGSLLLVQRTVTRTIVLQESIGKVSLDKGLSILLIFSKNQLFISLILCIVSILLISALNLIISLRLFLLGDFASSSSRAFSFDLVDLSIGWNLPSSAFCKAGFVDRLGLFMVSQISWTFCFMTFLDLVFSLTDKSISSIGPLLVTEGRTCVWCPERSDTCLHISHRTGGTEESQLPVMPGLHTSPPQWLLYIPLAPFPLEEPHPNSNTEEDAVSPSKVLLLGKRECRERGIKEAQVYQPAPEGSGYQQQFLLLLRALHKSSTMQRNS